MQFQTGKMTMRRGIGLLKGKDISAITGEDRKLVDHELAIAEQIQSNLVPKQMPRIEGYDFGAYYKACKDVGGDYYDFIEITPDLLGILAADVSGKGVPASMVMTAARAYIRSQAIQMKTDSPSEILKKVNYYLHQDLKRGMFVTVFFAILNIKDGTLSSASAGHNPMVIWRKGANTLHLVNTGGLALGIDKGPIFERTIKEQKVRLFKGDRFVLYTDGIVESMNSRKEQFGANNFYRKIKEAANKSSSEFVEIIKDLVIEHQGAAPQHDDMTIVTGRVLP